jgi:toxin ParE1/3/4
MSAPNRRLIFTSEAREDLRDIQRYSVRQWGTRQGRLYRAKLVDACDRLVQFPFLGSVSPNLAQGLRAHAVDQHVIYYLVDGHAVVIVRIIHVKMDATAQLGP